MPATLLPNLNMTELSDAHRVLPQAPRLTSASANWTGIYLAHYRHAPGETCEHTMQQHVLDIPGLGPSVPHRRWLNGKRHQYSLSHGEIDLCPAQVSHRACWDAPIQFLLLTIEPQFFQQVADEAELSPSLLPKIKFKDALLLQLAHSLHHDLMAGCPAGSIYAETLGRALILQLIKTCTSSSVAPVSLQPSRMGGLSCRAFKEVRDYIEAHLDREIRLEELAAIANLSPTYFCRRFKQSTGFAPHQYIIRRRVARAQQLLQQRKIPLVDVALRCGFGNQSLLNRHFKRITGLTPGTVRTEVL